jgi:hypothetical protein
MAEMRGEEGAGGTVGAKGAGGAVGAKGADETAATLADGAATIAGATGVGTTSFIL